MIDARELRIGNWVRCYVAGITDRHDDVQVNKYHLTDIIDSVKGYDYNPIPLTEEWLTRFGFPKHRSTLALFDDYSLVLERHHNELFVKWEVSAYVYQVEYVHQLQNLYFALTGEELEIKET